jgi:hypothetical protein
MGSVGSCAVTWRQPRPLDHGRRPLGTLGLFVQFSTNIRRHHTDLLHGFFQYFRRYSQLFGPVANLMILMDVDPVAVPEICHVRIVRHAVNSHLADKADVTWSDSTLLPLTGQIFCPELIRRANESGGDPINSGFR